MSMTLASGSHLDHNLSQEHIAWLLALFADRNGFFVETVIIPDELGDLECGLYGPIMGDEPVAETDVTYAVRGKRRCASRLVARPMRKTRFVTVIAGPYEDKPCVLFTAYGGPSAPREPGDTTIDTWGGVQDSRGFWAEHALSNAG